MEQTLRSRCNSKDKTGEVKLRADMFSVLDHLTADRLLLRIRICCKFQPRLQKTRRPESLVPRYQALNVVATGWKARIGDSRLPQLFFGRATTGTRH